MKAICVTLIKLALASLATYIIIVYILGIFPPMDIAKLLGS
jgi:hypothetical protein